MPNGQVDLGKLHTGGTGVLIDLCSCNCWSGRNKASGRATQVVSPLEMSFVALCDIPVNPPPKWCQRRAQEHVADIQVAQNTAWFSLQGPTWTTASFSLCFPAQGYQGLTVCVCSAASEREHDLPHSGCPSCRKDQPFLDFLLLLSPILHLPSEHLSETPGDRGHHREKVYTSPDSVTEMMRPGIALTQSDCLCMVAAYHGFLLSPALPCFATSPGTAPLQLQHPCESLTGQVPLLLSQLLLSHNFLSQPPEV